MYVCMKCVLNFGCKNWRNKTTCEDLDAEDGRIIKGIKMGCEDVGWIKLAQYKGPVVGYCEHSNESFGTIKLGYFLAMWMSDFQLLK
jgi:hypothetical protein